MYTLYYRASNSLARGSSPSLSAFTPADSHTDTPVPVFTYSLKTINLLGILFQCWEELPAPLRSRLHSAPGSAPASLPAPKIEKVESWEPERSRKMEKERAGSQSGARNL